MATILEHIKNTHKEVKNKPPKERLAYFWDYYKWPFLAVVLAIVLLAQTFISISNRKDIVFSGVLLNCKISVEEKALLEEFYAYSGIDTDTQQAAFYADMMLVEGQGYGQNNLNTFQRIMAGIVTKETDFIAGKPEAFQMCAYNSNRLFADLRTVLSAQQLEQWADRLFYVDGAVLDQMDVPVGTHIETSLLDYPDPNKPEEMDDPIPVGIDISDCKDLADAFYLPDSTVYFGIIANTTRLDLTLQFLEFLFA